VHLIPASERFDLALIGRNLTNSYYKVFAYQQSLGTNTQYNATFNRPREVALQASYKW
jgi:outer membrane receptor protein involved in Fe transport